MKNRGKICSWLVVASIALMIATGQAQQPPSSRRFGAFGLGATGASAADQVAVSLRLVTDEKVQQDLKLTAEQVTSLTKLPEKSERALYAGLTGPVPTSNEDRLEAVQKALARRTAAAKQVREEMQAILSSQQAGRLDEIRLQCRGVEALRDAEIIRKLALSDDQVRRLYEIRDSGRTELIGTANDGDARREKIDELMKESAEKSLAVLTAEQKTDFEKMQGEKIELNMTKFTTQSFRRRNQ